ncbi:adenine deaminase [Jeotgalibacillus sp. S-D1]|uniref:adenine deaminase n=1 Tax=Jeotgalibacillus sp. S-D1 TaxID=2552189 RepID=UPI00105A4AF1|nr:adenine deaminase [Jeotgalibacillus sp. S-D1]TDL30735.1 adenine deaminase [Jeotgalibacillus sp. S-D1]
MTIQQNPSIEEYTKRIGVSQRKLPADLVIKNGKIINVYTLEIISADIAIADGYIAAIGENYEGLQVIDADGCFLSPSFIDGHIHIESTNLTPSEFAKAVLPHGVTTIITDPHEIANVLGKKGIEYMLNNAEGLPMDIFYVLPSSVPATSFEHAGALLKAEDLKPFYDHPSVIGLAEVMDYPAVMNADSDMLHKIKDAAHYSGLIDGHLAGLSTNEINGYLSVGIRNDHECTTAAEALERVRLGMRVMIRQGSGSKNLPALLEAVNEKNASRFSFCTDDKHIDELIEEGSINHCVKEAIALGLDPLTAYQMGTLNAAQVYQLHDRGAISPGMKADILVVSDLEKVDIKTVIKDGKVIAHNSALIKEWPHTTSGLEGCVESVNMKPITVTDLKIKPEEAIANIIEIIPNQIVTRHTKSTVPTDSEGYFLPSAEQDLQKLVVAERHHARGTLGACIVKGFNLTPDSAIASTVAHDSHNIIAAGTSDEAIMKAIDWLNDHQGGFAVVKDGKVIGAMELRLAGLMSIKPMKEAAAEMETIQHALKVVSPSASFHLFSILSFLALPVIPALKLTDIGLFNVRTFSHIKV